MAENDARRARTRRTEREKNTTALRRTQTVCIVDGWGGERVDGGEERVKKESFVLVCVRVY